MNSILYDRNIVCLPGVSGSITAPLHLIQNAEPSDSIR